jgi:hypothetical protein
MVTGELAADGMSGSLEFGNAHPMQELTGAIRTTTIISVAGRCMKAIGTMKTTAITTAMITIVANPAHSGLQTEGPFIGLFCLHGIHSSVRIRCS